MAGPRRKSGPDPSEDAFVAGLLRIVTWAQKNQRALILAGGAIAILAGGIYYYIDYRGRLTEVASSEIQALRNQARSDGGQQVIQGLRSFLAQFGETAYATEARVLLAETLLSQGQAAEAIEPARVAAQEIGEDALATRAGFLLAAAREEVGDTAGAVQAYQRIADGARMRSDRARALEGMARLRAASGDVAAAIAAYDRLIELVEEENPRRTFYEMRRAELQAERERITLGSGGDGG